MILIYVLAAGIRRSPVKFPSLIPCLVIIIARSNISLQRIEFTQEMNTTAYNQNLMKEQTKNTRRPEKSCVIYYFM